MIQTSFDTDNGERQERETQKHLLTAILQRDSIPALTLTDPWGTLVAMGAKRYETRSWKTRYRGPLAIHISGTLTEEGVWMCEEEEVASVLEKAGYSYASSRHVSWELPLKKMIAVVWLEEIHEIRSSFAVDARERRFGNYHLGRFAWEFGPVYRLHQPILARGNRLIWKWTPPDTFWDEIQSQLDAVR